MSDAPAPAASVLVTGAGRGIGRAIALHLAEHTSVQLVLASKSERALDTAKACNTLRANCARGFVINIDNSLVGDAGPARNHPERSDLGAERSEAPGGTGGTPPAEDSGGGGRAGYKPSGPARNPALEALAALPGPVGLVHCAGVLGPTGDFADNDLDAWWAAMQTNLLGAVRLVHAVLPRMQADGAGRIVLFAGGGAAYGYPHFSSYGTAKAALVRFTETLAMELGDSGPVVTIMAPGANDTDMLAQVRAAGGYVKTTVDISEPCRAVARLLSEDTRGLNGRFIHVRDEWTAESAAALPENFWKLRRVEPKRE